MVQVLESQYYSSVSIEETEDLKEIEEALIKFLYVPDTQIKHKVVENVCSYLQSKFSIPGYKIKFFIAYSKRDPCGFVVADLNPEFKSYGRRCGTFGWLNARSYKVCKELLKQCELFARENKLRKIRGPINFPKNEMGFGLQTQGFNQQPLFGVAFTNPNSKLYEYLKALNYIAESEYTSLRVEHESWKKGNTLDKNLKLCIVPLDKLIEKLDDVIALTLDSFSTLLPDTSGGGIENVKNLIKLAVNVPKSHFRYHESPDIYKNYQHIPEFIEAWEEADLKNVITVFPMVLERNTEKIVGMLIGVLDYYQYWKNEYISRVNVHTAMVRKGYGGRGIFSSLNNFGQVTNRAMMGLTYYEGTYIWSKNSKGVNNKKAVNSVFPHCTPIRTHVVFEKRVK
ncbi:MAG: hypothetical protein ACXAC5_07835 [Promethearchaeota archaeon]|jgi:hypothetical protein